MAVVVELFEGRTEVFDSTGNRAEIPYLVSEAYDEAEVKAERGLMDNAPRPT